MRVFRSYAIKEATEGGAGMLALLSRMALALLSALIALALGVAVAPGRARAAPSGATIVFVSPIYPGQNSGHAEGPVGAQVNVQGSGWDANTNVNITLADMSNDTSSQPGSACQSGSTLMTAGTATSDGSGNLAATFLWPSNAGTKGHSYWACGDEGGTPSLGMDYYKVLSANPPSAQINVSQATAGSSITVTGQNWLPGNQQIGVIVEPCIACTPGYSTKAQTTAQADGTFSVPVQVPSQAPVGTKLYVSVQNIDTSNPANTNALHTEPTNTPTFTVIAQPTVTPTPTNTATPTATSTSTATATSTRGGNGGGNGGGPDNTSNGSSGGLLIVLLSALGAVLLAAAVVALLLFLRSRGPAPGTAGGGYPPGSGYGQYNPPRRSGGRPPTDPRYQETNIDYYGGQPQSPGWGGWHGNARGPEDEEGFGDAPTVGPGRPRR